MVWRSRPAPLTHYEPGRTSFLATRRLEHLAANSTCRSVSPVSQPRGATAHRLVRSCLPTHTARSDHGLRTATVYLTSRAATEVSSAYQWTKSMILRRLKNHKAHSLLASMPVMSGQAVQVSSPLGVPMAVNCMSSGVVRCPLDVHWLMAIMYLRGLVAPG